MTEFTKKNFEKIIKEKDNLKKANRELAVLNNLARAISSTMSLEKILNKVVQESIKALDSEQGTIHLLNLPGSEKGHRFHTIVRQNEKSLFDHEFRLNDMLAGWMLKNISPLVVNDFDNNDLFPGMDLEELNFKSLLCVPLLCKGNLIGILSLFNKKNGSGFSDDDKRLLAIIASQSAQIIENARLYEEEKQLRQVERELGMARSIQTRLLPKEAPKFDEFDIAGVTHPAKEIGGDYFDFIPTEEGKLCVALGDVSGKGIPAALLMSNLQATLRNQLLNSTDMLAVIAATNRFLSLNIESNQFITIFCGMLEKTASSLVYVNCGHNPPYYLDNNSKLTKLGPNGLAMGVYPDTLYSTSTLKLVPGDIVVIYSDGVTEAENKNNEMFGEKRLEKLILDNKNQTAQGLIDVIYNSIKSYNATKKLDDDLTLVAIKVKDKV